MDLSVVVVTYNSEEYVHNCISSITRAVSSLDHELFVVDNHSTDRTLEFLRRFPNSLQIIENRENHGFARAANQGLRRSSGEFCLLINPDSIIQSDSLEPLVRFLRSRPHIGICGCKLCNVGGSLQYSKGSFPTLFSTLSRRILPRRMRKYHLVGYNSVGQCDWVTGAFMAIRKQLLEKLGYFDENYFIYYEDVDFCLRARNAGMKTYYFPQVVTRHFSRRALSNGNLWIAREIHKSRLYYFQKNRTRISHAILSFLTHHVEERFFNGNHSG